MKVEDVIKEFLDIAKDFDNIKKIILFGSFAKDMPTKTSDIDIAISGEFNYFELIDRIKNEINTIRSFDIINYDEISSENLKREIDLYGRVLYDKVQGI